jgi:hypothetical protein
MGKLVINGSVEGQRPDFNTMHWNACFFLKTARSLER